METLPSYIDATKHDPPSYIETSKENDLPPAYIANYVVNTSETSAWKGNQTVPGESA